MYKRQITNSYHIHVTEHIDAFSKLAFESKFQALSPGGAISYVEVPNMQNNIPAVLEVMKFIYDHIMYAELNTKSDYCQVCGYDGEIEIKEDKDGKLITESVTDYSEKNILGEYATLDSFLRAWNSEEKKQAIIDELQERGVLLEALRQIAGNKDIDDFDLICHIAYDKAPLTKAERANNVRKRGYLYKYSGLAQEVLSALLDKYMNEGIQDIENLEILSNDPFRKFGTPMKIAKLFGGKNGYIQAIRDLQKEIYAA